MASQPSYVQLKRSVTAGHVPGSLREGEPSVTLPDPIPSLFVGGPGGSQVLRVNPVATAAQILAGTANLFVSTDQYWAALGWVQVNGDTSGTLTLDLSTGINFLVVLAADTTITLTNGKNGQIGYIAVAGNFTVTWAPPTLTPPPSPAFAGMGSDKNVVVVEYGWVLGGTGWLAQLQPAAGGGAGTVTSVDMTVPENLLTVSGNPVTTAGTLALALAAKGQNLVFASPDGSSGVPDFRALTTADLPAIPMPSVKRYLSGSGVYTSPAGCAYIEVEMIGGGGGGGGNGAGGGGGPSAFELWSAAGGGGGQPPTGPDYTAAGLQGAGGTGGATGTGVLIDRQVGGNGNVGLCADGVRPSYWAPGGNGFYGGGGQLAGAPNSGAGGNGGNNITAGIGSAGAGGAGESVRFLMPPGSYAWAVGAGGAAGPGGTNIANGNAGASGKIVVKEYYLPGAAAGASLTVGTPDPVQISQPLSVPAPQPLVQAADDAQAASEGVQIGQFYANGNTVMVRLQ